MWMLNSFFCSSIFWEIKFRLIRVRRNNESANCRALNWQIDTQRNVISSLTEPNFPQGFIDPKYLVVWKRIGIQSPIFWIAKHPDGEVQGVTKWRSAGYPSANYFKLKVRRSRLSGLLLPRIHSASVNRPLLGISPHPWFRLSIPLPSSKF